MMCRHRQATAFRSEFIAPRQGCLPLPDHNMYGCVCVCSVCSLCFLLGIVVVVKATRAQSNSPLPRLFTTSPAPTPIPFGLALIDVTSAVASDFAKFVQPSAASWSNSRSAEYMCVSLCGCESVCVCVRG